MKKLFLFIFLASSSLSSSRELLSLEGNEWLGFWVGYETRKFDFAVGCDGTSQFMMKQRGKKGIERVSLYRKFLVTYNLEERSDSKKWRKRTMLTDSFETDQTSSLDAEKFNYSVDYKGGGRVAVDHEIDGREVKIKIENLTEESKAEQRVGVTFKVPETYRNLSSFTEQEIVKKMRGDEVGFVTTSGKKIKLALSDIVELSEEEFAKEGVSKFYINSKALGGKTLSLSLDSKDSGEFVFGQPRKRGLYKGFTITWYPKDSTKTSKPPVLLVEVE